MPATKPNNSTNNQDCYVLVEVSKATRKSPISTWTPLPGGFPDRESANNARADVAASRSVDLNMIQVRHVNAKLPDDKEFWTTRKAQLKAIDKLKSPVYFIERFGNDGTLSSTKIHLDGQNWIREDVSIDGTVNVQNLGEASSLKEIASNYNDAFLIADELTLIYSHFGDHEILDLLSPNESRQAVDGSESWDHFPAYQPFNWNIEDDYIEDLAEELGDGVTVNRTTARLNENILLRVSGGPINGYMPLNSHYDNEHPVITNELISNSFWRDSDGAPISWDGSTSIGYVGPAVWATIVEGDIAPGVQLSLVTGEEDIHRIALDYFSLDRNIATAFMLNAIGLPDRHTGSNRPWDDGDGQGQFVSIALPDAAVAAIITELVSNSLHLKNVELALKDSSTPLGELVYELADEIDNSSETMWSILDLLNRQD